ncbi:hypothetical protein NPIL_604331 [Nephila pilipes]|uniref:Uncharacterized protein n=1 Tax=Nephila pilipes TaxID=299642 RepID=A0A8X6N932_NEPPI|nr:hypothetical protein NPIL_604331 [Nephila pilipes]
MKYVAKEIEGEEEINLAKRGVVSIQSTAKKVNCILGKFVQLIKGKDGEGCLAKNSYQAWRLTSTYPGSLSVGSSPIDEDLRQQIEGHTIWDTHDESTISSDSLSLVPISGERLPPTSVPRRINRYG